MASLESAESSLTRPSLKRKRSMMSTNGPRALKRPKPTNSPLSNFSYFTSLPAETRLHIWTIAILRDLRTDKEAPPCKAGPIQSKQSTQTEQPKPEKEEAPPPPRLHIIPFHTLPTKSPFTSVHTYLTARYGKGWEGNARERLSPEEAEAATAQRSARVAEGEAAVKQHALTRTLLFPPGHAPRTAAGLSAGWYRSGVVASCREAEAVANSWGRLASGGACNRDIGPDGAAVPAGGWETLVGLERGDVCCFVNVQADGSPIWRKDMLRLWDSRKGAYGSYHTHEDPPRSFCGDGFWGDHLGLFPGGREWVGAVREGWGCDDEMLAGVVGLKGLLPALAQCEVLVGVWHPAMCRHFRPAAWYLGPDGETPPLLPLCAKFEEDLESLPLRYPRLKTIYIIDPMIKPYAPGLGPGMPRPEVLFRGRGVAFYALSGHFSSEDTNLDYPYSHRLWREMVSIMLENVTDELVPERSPIQVSILACVPDEGCGPDSGCANHEW